MTRIVLMFCCWSVFMAGASPIAMVIHGGAGTLLKENMTPEVEQAYRDMLEKSVRAGHDILKAGGSSTDAVIAAIVIMEDSDLFNAGKGAVLTHDGHVEMDASIMRGSDLNAGAVAGIRHIRNPIRLARAVMDHSPHVMLIGEGAEAFAASLGFDLIENSYFQTERRRKQLEKAKGEHKMALSEDESDDHKFGTVGAVAIDRLGNIAAATSTGGMTNKQFGRVGDSPIIGAGTYADNASCGISATGHGEYFIRAAVAHDICARVLHKGITLQQAADEVVMKKLVDMNGEGGIIGIDHQAEVVFSFNSLGMYRAAVNRDGKLTVEIFK